MKSLLAQNIEFRMKVLGLNVKKLERNANLKLNAIHNILSGRSQNPNVYLVLTIAKALNCTIYELLGETQHKSSETPLILDPSHQIAYPDLMRQSINYVLAFIETYERSITITQLTIIADQIYHYSLNTSSKQIDERFAQWITLDRIGVGPKTHVYSTSTELEPA